MRNKDRIPKFCDRLAKAWQRLPDQRFGQFILNVLGDMAATGRDPFFPEDDEMIAFIEKWVGEYWNSPSRLANNHIEEICGND